ncbi:hypothetical protein ACVXHA_04725 [Escherichia coli]
MLNERQLKIVDLLEQQPRTPGELARQTGVQAGPSCVILTISTSPLTAKPAFSPVAVRAIELEIFERAQLFQLLQKHDNDDRLLALLLLNTFTPRAQLASALNLPETWVAERLPRLNSVMNALVAWPAALVWAISLMRQKRNALSCWRTCCARSVFNSAGGHNTRQPSAFIHGLRQPTPLAAHAG